MVINSENRGQIQGQLDLIWDRAKFEIREFGEVESSIKIMNSSTTTM